MDIPSGYEHSDGHGHGIRRYTMLYPLKFGDFQGRYVEQSQKPNLAGKSPRKIEVLIGTSSPTDGLSIAMFDCRRVAIDDGDYMAMASWLASLALVGSQPRKPRNLGLKALEIRGKFIFGS